MFRYLKSYFKYSRGQIRGIFVLIILIVAVFIAPHIINKYSKTSNVDFSAFEKQITNFENQVALTNKSEGQPIYERFYFDPNKVSESDLIRLGLSSKQAKTLLKYRKAGGVFKVPSDLKKVYSISNEMYNELEQFIRIEYSTTNQPAALLYEHNELSNELPKAEKVKVKKLIIDLNSADSNTLMKLPGIGSVLSQRIVNYRNFLGGYYSTNQLLEVYGINADTYKLIKNNLVVDSLHIQKINLNTAEFKTLNMHPYISYADTKAILKFRELMGKYSNLDDLIDNKLVDSTTYCKIRNYLTVQ